MKNNDDLWHSFSEEQKKPYYGKWNIYDDWHLGGDDVSIEMALQKWLEGEHPELYNYFK